jgi:ATP-binding cassette, subfamily G (WHITE), member 2, SNQ2
LKGSPEQLAERCAGVLFIGLLFNSLNAFSELPSQMQGRGILYKQSGYRFYRPSAVSFSASLADMPFSSIRILIFWSVLRRRIIIIADVFSA